MRMRMHEIAVPMHMVMIVVMMTVGVRAIRVQRVGIGAMPM